MARDVNEFISEALKEGYDINDVVDFMSNHKDEGYRSWASNWSATANAPEYKTGSFGPQIEFEEKAAKLKSDYEKKLKEATTTNIGGFEIPSILTGAGTGILGAAGLGAVGLWGAGKVASKLKERSIKNPQVAEAAGDVAKTVRTEPIFDLEPTTEQPVNRMQQLKERVEQGKAAGLGVQPPVQNVPTPNVPEASVQAPVQSAAPVQPPVAQPPAQQATPAIADAVAAGESPAKAIQMDVAKQIEATPTGGVAPETGVKKRAAKTTINFKSAEKLPEDLSFRADLGPGDNWLFNTYGSEGRKAILAQFNEGKPAVSYERAKELSQLLQQERTGPTIPRDVAKERGIAPPETNYGKLGKAIKVAGVAGLGLTAAQAALAKSPQERALAGADLLSAFLPFGLDIGSAGEGSTLPENVRAKQEEFAMLGSPYYQTQEAKNFRQAKKVGAGRGIAPPSQYQR